MPKKRRGKRAGRRRSLWRLFCPYPVSSCLCRSASRGRRRGRTEIAFSNPAHRNHDDDPDEQAGVVPLWKVDSDACTSRDGNHAEQNDDLGEKRVLLRAPSFDCRRWTFWHDVFAGFGLRDRGLSSPAAGCRLKAYAVRRTPDCRWNASRTLWMTSSTPFVSKVRLRCMSHSAVRCLPTSSI